MTQELLLSKRYQDLVEQIEKLKEKRNRPLPLTLIAVSKKQPVDAIEELYRLGHRDFGENYVQELITKAIQLKERGCTDIQWHFIGHLQTNKVKSLIPWVASIHTLDSNRLAAEVAKRWKESGRPGKLPVFIEVNLDEEETKSGVSPNEVLELAKKVVQWAPLSLQGLMCVPLAGSDPTSRFRKLAELEQQLRSISNRMLSMGMSGDYEIAIEQGATHIRLGTILFSARK